ncbi:MAG: TIGR01777 family protein [Pedosphaera sp. Tous-C6FEB]|nr:MAG: TIGR01777 family protein [Pedosphaera sp. Tous-C6FEB]
MNKQRLILAGGTGFLGQALAKHFQSLGWEVVVITRNPQAGRTAREVRWDAETLGDWARELDGAAAVVNLTGRSVDCRYTEANRRLILDSRVNSTRVIGQAIAQCAQPPRVWLNSSSATIYRHTLGPAWDESGTDFAPTPAVQDEFSLEVIHAWEQALNDAVTPRTRKVALRTTLVLGNGQNSVFPVLSRLARFGLGGRMGSGQQFVSWLHESDFLSAVEFLIAHEELAGPVNLAAPNPLPNAEMMRLFRESVGAPFGLPATEWMLEIGAFFLRTETELILKSRRVVPGKLLASGFAFRFPTMREALADLRARRG